MTVKIYRTTGAEREEAEVDPRWLPDFLADGWHELSASKEKNHNEKNLKEENAKNEAEQKERDILVAKAVQEKEDEHKIAMARIQAELDEFREREANRIKAEQEAALNDSKKRHEQKILLMEDKDAITDYAKEHLDLDVDKRGSLEVVRDKAIKAIQDKQI